MMGPSRGDKSKSEMGMYAMAALDIFENLRMREHRGLSVYTSFFEIYGGKLFDLFNERKRLVAREDAKQNVNIVGLREVHCSSTEQVLELIQHGSLVRSTGSTCLLYTSPSPRDRQKSRMPSSA